MPEPNIPTGKASMEKATVFDIQRFSVHDGPGIRTIVFFKGCPLNCQWCANPESQRFVPELFFFPDKCIGCGKCTAVCRQRCIIKDGDRWVFERENCIGCLACAEVCSSKARAGSGREMTCKEIIAEVDKDLVFYQMSGGGVTFSGGEALCFPETIARLARHYRDKGISTAAETCGHVPWENFEKVLPYMDLLLFDLKLMNRELHRTYTGDTNELILSNLKKVCALVDTIVRIPIIPAVNDSSQAIEEFGRFLADMKEDLISVNLLPYHNFGEAKYAALGRPYLLEDLKAPSEEQMERIKKQLEGYGLKVQIGG